MAVIGAARARLGTQIAGGLIWLSSAQFFVVQALAQKAFAGSAPYSLRRSWISDLGATSCGSYSGGGGIVVCSPRHVLLNVGLVVLGVQVVAGAVLLRPLLLRGGYARASVALLTIAGLALPFVAAFPEDTGKPWHAVAATIHLAAAGLGTVSAGLALRRTGRPRAATVTLVLGVVSVLGTLLTGAGLGADVGRGAIERLAAWPFTVWTTVAGAWALMAISRTRRASP